MAPKIVAELPADWAPSDELRSRAKMEGVQELDGHIARLRLGPIGGTRGVFSHQLDAYIGNMLGKMRMWEEADRAKAGGRSDPFKAAPPEGGVRGFPAWVRKNHVEYLAGDRKTLKLFAQRFAKEHHIPPSVLLPNDAATAFTAFLREVIATPGEAA